MEVDLCGHATLASAHVLWQQRSAEAGERIEFATRSGILAARRNGDDIVLDFRVSRSSPPNLQPSFTALGVAAQYVGRNQFDYLVEVESESVLRQIAPDFKRWPPVPVRGTIVTSRSSDARFDFVSRFSPRPPASTKIPSPARPTAAWPTSGRNGSDKANSRRTRPHRAAACSASASPTTACFWGAKPSPWRPASSKARRRKAIPRPSSEVARAVFELGELVR